MIEQSPSELKTFQRRVEGARATDRVKRMRDVLTRLEAEERQFEDFLATIALLAYDTQNDSINVN